MTQTYELANAPYYRQPENVTIVTIKKEHGQRYSYEQAGLSGDRTHESQEVLIQAVLDVVKAELDPASAIVQTQAKLEEATHELAETKAKQTATDEAVKHNILIRLSAGTPTELAILPTVGTNVGHTTPIAELNHDIIPPVNP